MTGQSVHSDNPTAKKPGRQTLLPEPEAKQKFLKALAKQGNVTAACKAARIHRDTAYTWRAADAAFADAWKHALDDAADVLEAEGWRRAVKGTDKPVYQGGQQVGSIREYSDTLLIFLLKGARPEKYRENVKHEHSGANGGPIPIRFFDAGATLATIAAGSDEGGEDA